MKSSSSGLYRNIVSYAGFLIMVIGALLTLFTTLLDWSLKSPSPYIGIFSYMIFPAIVTFGLLVFLYGMRRESLRRRRLGTDEALPFPRVDLNDPTHRKKFGYVTVGSLILVIIMGFSGYNMFLFTESNTFCGKICHTVMEPEYSAYQHSPHARVHCVDCHVGSGASFYVKSKMSGVRQVLAVVFNTYQKPIPTPIHNLRPARETCEKCHWPNKFYGAQLRQIPYFRLDEKNTSDQVSFLVKTGGGSPELGRNAGIHWHMIIENSISFAARDEQLQEIPWFKVKGMYGQERVYMNREHPVTPEELAGMEKHTMDCIHCHNRPTHIYYPPDRALDLAMDNGTIPSDIPWIKKVTEEALVASYPDNETAGKEIRDKVFNFYANQYPDLYKERSEDLQKAVQMATEIYDRTVFPKMNVDWSTYPNNIGHRIWPGCFRCHDGKHATEDGKVLTTECTACHTMPQRGPLESLGQLPPVTDISWHPFSLAGKHGETLCHECHKPEIRPSSECSSCHVHPAEAPMAQMDCGDCHEAAPELKPIIDCAACHEDRRGLHLEGGHPDMECIDCHTPHTWTVTERSACLTCHDGMEDHNSPEFCGECHEF